MNKEEAGRNVDPKDLALHARIGSNQELQKGLEPALHP